VREASPSTVFGLPAYNAERHLAEALESLLAQTRGDLAILVVDDCSSDGTHEIAARYADLDSRVLYQRNDRQLGLVRNWRRAFELAGRRFPEAAYFAWASDHDVWHARWLEALAAELDAHSEAVLAYPLFVRIDGAGAEYPTREQRFETAGVASPVERVRRTARALTTAGELVYGLARCDALERCGPFPLVVLPDRLHLLRLAFEGEFRQVSRRLWHRRYRAGVVVSNRRQRRAFFPDGVPLWARAPWWLAHPLLLRRSLNGQRGRSRLAASILVDSLRHAYGRWRNRVRRSRRWRRRGRRRLYAGALRRFGVLRRPAARVEAAAPAGRQLDALRKLAGDEAFARLRGVDPEDLVLLEALVALERAEILPELAEAGAVVLELGGHGLTDRLQSLFPHLARGSVPATQVDLAISIDALAELASGELPNARYLYSLDREDATVRRLLARDYWLRDLWVLPRAHDEWLDEGPRARKPDPRKGPVPVEPGRYRHLLGRRRLIPAPR
jgi:glycosyltransferase involved in cell wall biosynthesis